MIDVLTLVVFVALLRLSAMPTGSVAAAVTVVVAVGAAGWVACGLVEHTPRQVHRPGRLRPRIVDGPRAAERGV